MAWLSRADLKTLVQNARGVCVSIYLPTHRVGLETRQDPIRLRNLLGQAEDRLLQRGLRVPDAQALLRPAHDLLSDGAFWRHQQNSLALFASGDVFRTYGLPTKAQELVVVADRFHLKPLLRVLFSSDGQFYILALSQNSVRVLRCNRYECSEVEPNGLPASMAEALQYDEPEQQLQFHTRTAPGGQGERGAMFHGHGVGTDDTKDDLLRYFRQVDHSLRRLVQDEQAPVVMAGVDYLLPLYREASDYANLMEAGIPGNPEDVGAETLHQKAWDIMWPHYQKGRQAAAEHYQDLSETGRTSNDLTQILVAAHQARIAYLFVDAGQQQWGTFDPATQSVELHAEARPGDEDLLDLAALQTFLMGGTVYAVEAAKLPEAVAAAAIFRY